MTRRLLLSVAINALAVVAQESAPPPKTPATDLSPGVPAVIRMVQAGVPTEMIVKAIESSGVAIQGTPDDLAALTQAGAADEVIRAITAGRHGNPPKKEDELPAITLRTVRKIYVDKMANDLDQYLLVEISKQLKGVFIVVLRPEDADALLVGMGDEKTGVRATVAGRVLGLQDTATGLVSLVDRTKRIVLWSSEAGDRSLPGGLLRGGQAKVAHRLIHDLRRALGLVR